MKDIYTVFNELEKSNITHWYKNEYDFKRAEEYFNRSINRLSEDDELNKLVLSGKDYILENLNTHDYKLLQKKLIEKFGDDIIINSYIYDKDCTDKNSFIVITQNKSFFENKQFLQLLSFFNYTLREIKDIENNEYAGIIEPIFSDRINLTGIYKIYHITKKNFVESILKNGLRVRKPEYANVDKRIYLYIPKDNKLKLDITLIEFLNKLFNNVVIPSKLGFIEIDLYKMIKDHNEPWLYKDTAMKFDEAVFTLDNIPAKYLKEIKVV